ncbi:hypothetical protein F4553_004437 [Allocatelliglobosispora scoriae]|uniref:Uncharacterized protein n=1 Tax=Allocatelliglobosispora scoriae TaxID=643052 RepID=A0A841BUD5_9ACTN|nr:hypothetical protein [Allocatelliglobosispora scoriae]MBB5871058.1 hypothetical protein [Allocatelliglobosispora scoriae]
MADLRSTHTEPLLIQLAHVISGAPCKHCGGTPYTDHSATQPAQPPQGAQVVPSARVGEPRTVSRWEPEPVANLDEVGDEELWLWRLVDDADRVSAAAPVGPAPERIAAVEAKYAAATATEERVQRQIRAAEQALSLPSSWLRPSHRAAIARELRRDRAAAVLAAVQRSRVAEVRDRLRDLSMKRADYLTEHRVTIAAGANARAELTRLIDDLIDGYARLTPPPAWFRYGLGFPPAPGTYTTWLQDARAAIAARRRRATETF